MAGSTTWIVGRVTDSGKSGEVKRHVPLRGKTISPLNVPCPVDRSTAVSVIGVVPGLGGGKRPKQVMHVAVTVAAVTLTVARASICAVSHVSGGDGDTMIVATLGALGLGAGTPLAQAVSRVRAMSAPDRTRITRIAVR